MKAANTAGRLRLARRQPRPPAAAPSPALFELTTTLLKAVLGLSGIVYLTGFIVANAHFLALGVAEATLVDARYIASGALFLFIGLPVTLFPYLSGLAAMNRQYAALAGHPLSQPLDHLYRANSGLFKRRIGPFLVALCVIAVLPELGGSALQRDGPALLTAFVLWYGGSWLLSRSTVVIFNLGFYWRVRMISGQGRFWAGFRPAFLRSFKASFGRSFTLTNGRSPTDSEFDRSLHDYVIGGMAAEGFLASALYKGIALFVIHAITFASFVYPLVPASIGGGKAQQVVLLIAKEKSLGLEQLGLRGKLVLGPGEILDNAPGRLLTEPVQLLTKTSEAYLVQLQVDGRKTVLRIPAASVEGASYRGNR